MDGTGERSLGIVRFVENAIPYGHGVFLQELLVAERYQHRQLVTLAMIEVATYMLWLATWGATTQHHALGPRCTDTTTTRRNSIICCCCQRDKQQQNEHK